MSDTTVPGRLEGRRALVTGAGSGIGRATVVRLAEEGAAVAAVDVRREAADDVAAEVVRAGGDAVALGADVGDEAAVAAAVAAGAQALGGLDTVVACAGITMVGATHELSLDQWETMLRINLTGVFLTVKHALPHVLAAGGGSIVTIGSVGSLVAAGRTSAYDASKGGVLQLTRAVAVEYVDAGIRANCVCPGIVATNLFATSREVTDLDVSSGQAQAPSGRLQVPMSRAAEASEIASVVAFLCSDDASFLTGAAIPVDGGYTANLSARPRQRPDREPDDPNGGAMTERTTAPAVLGDRVPQAVADYFLALDGGRFDDAVACFSEAAHYAVPAPGLIETSPRLQTVGRGPLRDRFEARGARPEVHDILLCAVEGSTCILEGVSGTGSSVESSSFVASVELDVAGLIGRYLAYATAPAIVPAPGDVSTGAEAPGDAREVLDRYFTALDRGDFAAAADCFGADVLYSHPPYKHTGVDGDRRVEMHGRDALRKTFEARGAQSFDHRLLALIQRGPHCLVEGLVEGLPGGMSGSFVSSITLDGDGLIARYLSFYCEPSVPVG